MTTTASADDAWTVVRTVDVDVLDRDGVMSLLGSAKRVRSTLDALEVRAARRLGVLRDAGSGEAPEAAIAGGSGCSGRDASDVTEREAVCTDLADVEDALVSGSITAGHIDAIAAATRLLPEELRDEFATHTDLLLARTHKVSVDAFRRECRNLAKHLIARSHTGSDSDELDAQRAASQVKRWVDKITGMHHTMLELDPVRDAAVSAAVNAEIARQRQINGNHELSWKQLEINAWIATITDTVVSHVAGCPHSHHQARANRSHDRGDNVTDCASDRDIGGRGGDSGGEDGGRVGDGGGHVGGGGVGESGGRVGESGGRVGESGGLGGGNGGDRNDDHRGGRLGDSNSTGVGECTCNSGRRVVDRVPEIAVHISIERLLDDAHTAGICETSHGIALPVSTVRRMCCDAEIYPVVLSGTGEVLDQGRSIRTANRQQRRALRAQHRTCAFPACSVGYDHCRIHHITWWRNLGNTDIDNLIPLCERHHHLVHEGGWGLSMTPDRTATWTRPDGHTHHTGTTINRPTSSDRPGQPPHDPGHTVVNQR